MAKDLNDRGISKIDMAVNNKKPNETIFWFENKYCIDIINYNKEKLAKMLKDNDINDKDSSSDTETIEEPQIGSNPENDGEIKSELSG